jgi:hypothetical protein
MTPEQWIERSRRPYGRGGSAATLTENSTGGRRSTSVTVASTSGRLWAANRPGRRHSGYSSFRQLRGSAGWAFGVRSSRKLK